MYKPHLGKIERWTKQQHEDQDGKPFTIVWGTFVGHHRFTSHYGHTSYIVTHDEKTGQIETRNSRYTLVGKEQSE
jgi:hypothetical protein